MYKIKIIYIHIINKYNNIKIFNLYTYMLRAVYKCIITQSDTKIHVDTIGSYLCRTL